MLTVHAGDPVTSPSENVQNHKIPVLFDLLSCSALINLLTCSTCFYFLHTHTHTHTHTKQTEAVTEPDLHEL